MKITILHLNIEIKKHLPNVKKVIQDKNPDIVCLVEATKTEMTSLAQELGYFSIFTPRFYIQEPENLIEEGSIIFSKYPITTYEKYRYDENDENAPLPFSEITTTDSDQYVHRPSSRFKHHITLLAATLNLGKGKEVTITTTHFPVTDHVNPGVSDHVLKSIQDIKDIEHVSYYFDRLVQRLRSIRGPVVFTADLNNSRGEHIYDTLAHELIDIVPPHITSTIDPLLHRRKNLMLSVDTIMVSPEITPLDCEALEGISDHKALFASLEIV
jgi:endonuclease/exonuclease/phosphatase family metal-dependent hydrolase